MFIVKLDRQSEKSIALSSAFGKKYCRITTVQIRTRAIDVAYQTDLYLEDLNKFYFSQQKS